MTGTPFPLTVRPVPSASAVTLGDAGLLDWLAVGARSDLTVVRSKSSRQAPAVVVDLPPGATAVPGPFRVSWTGGSPEQSRSGASTWLSADGASGISLTLSASSQTRTVVLYLGSQDLAATLTLGGGVVAGPVSLGASSSADQGEVVTLQVPPAASPTRLQLGGAGTGPQPRLYLAAVTVAAAG